MSGTSGGIQSGVQTLETHQHTFQPFKNADLSGNFDQNMPKKRYFWKAEKSQRCNLVDIGLRRLGMRVHTLRFLLARPQKYFYPGHRIPYLRPFFSEPFQISSGTISK